MLPLSEVKRASPEAMSFSKVGTPSLNRRFAFPPPLGSGSAAARRDPRDDFNTTTQGSVAPSGTRRFQPLTAAVVVQATRSIWPLDVNASRLAARKLLTNS